MIRLRVTCDSSLPPMAWCARLRQGHDVELLAGSSVEVREGGFFEGAWAGDAGLFDFTCATDVFGSGGQIIGDDLVVVTPSHTLERVQFIQRRDETLVSNSLVFLLTVAGDELDPNHSTYARDFTRIIHEGIDAFDTAIPLRSAGRDDGDIFRPQAHLIYSMNIRFHRDGRISFVEKPAAPGFETFDEYVTLLGKTLESAVANAASPDRGARYSPLASISTGYDSPAVAALARRAGCERAVTFTHARANGRAPVAVDSGGPIADVLRYELKEFDCEAYRQIRSFPEAEFLATGMSGEDVNMLGLESDLRRSVFLSGHYGGRVWDLRSDPDEHLRRGDMSGASMNEFRLRTDFVHIPVPFVGARRHPKILEIGHSEAMKQWSVGTDYDRPVPRRIAEDAGVPRAAFGQEKRATTALLHVNGGAAWTPLTRDAVRRYTRRLGLPLRTRLSYALDAANEASRSLAYLVTQRVQLLPLLPTFANRPPGIHSHTRLGPLPILWSVEFITPRYQVAASAWRSG